MEAQTILGSLVCFPNLYLQIPILQRVPGSEDVVLGKEDIKVKTCFSGNVVATQNLHPALLEDLNIRYTAGA